MTLLKFTYREGAKKLNGYLKDETINLLEVKERIIASLFQQGTSGNVRFYWIDADGDEIDIVTQSDYNIFIEENSQRLHLLVAPKNDEEKPTESKAKDSSSATPLEVPPNVPSTSIHHSVECDSCLMAPIVGFRYKCIQCPNYDICQNCEAKHVHGDHMMVRMPNNSCPYVTDAWISSGGCGRKLGRKHEKRCKTGDAAGRQPFGFNIAAASVGGGDVEKPNDGEPSDRHHGRKHARRHARNTFFSHFYNMMHDLAEGGGAAAAAAEASASTSGEAGNTTTNTTSTTTTTSSGDNIDVDAAAKSATAAALAAAKNAHEAAVKSAEIAAKVAHETAHSAAASTSAAAGEAIRRPSNDKVDATTSPDARSSVPPSPSLQDFVQLLDPKLLRSGMDILNNFNDMFAKMLDPMDGAEGGDSVPTSCPFAANLRKSSTVSSQSASSKKSNDSINSTQSNQSKTSNNSMSKDKVEVNGTEEKVQKVMNNLFHLSDVGSDSESDSISESFIKLNAPIKENTPETANPGTSTPAPSQSSTPPQSLNKSNVMDFAQLSADLKAHIAQEDNQNQKTPAATVPEIADVEMRAVPVFKTPSATESSPTAPPKNPEDKRAVPVYHADQRINNSVHAMMSMGFSNDGAWLTQLLESVNGNIPEALDLISATQNSAR